MITVKVLNAQHSSIIDVEIYDGGNYVGKFQLRSSGQKDLSGSDNPGDAIFCDEIFSKENVVIENNLTTSKVKT